MLCSCGNGGTPAESTAPESTTPAETEAPTPKGVIINSENAASVVLIRPDSLKSGTLESEIFSAFRTKLCSVFDARIMPDTDFIIPGKTEDANALEIIVGDTERASSKVLNGKLKALGSHAYGIYVSGNKISVSGTAPYLTYLALDHLISNLMTADASGKAQIYLEDGFEWIETAESEYPDPWAMLESDGECAFKVIEHITDIQPRDGFRGMQGGGTDGKYAYYAYIDNSTTPEMAIIFKFDMSNWKLVAVSEPMQAGHANGITYDSKNDRLVLSFCSKTDGYMGLIFVNPNTLEMTGYYNPKVGNRGLAYLPKTDQYILAGTYGFTLTDSNFVAIRKIEDGFPKLVSQDCDVDEKYIYDIRWESGAKYQTVSINSLEGEFIGAVPAYGFEGEPENIFRDGNTFVVGCNDRGKGGVYRMVLFPAEWWD